MKDAHRSGQLEEHFFFLFIFIIVIFSIVFPWAQGIGEGGAMEKVYKNITGYFTSFMSNQVL